MDQEFKIDLVHSYDGDAAARDERVLPVERIGFRERFIDLLLTESRASLIEFGAGAGHDAVGFSSAGLSVVAMDLSPENVANCRAKGIEAQVGDFYDLDLPDGAFEAGWAMSTLLHVPDSHIDRVLNEIIRVLKPGAPLAIGLWGGIDHEGIHEDDWADPKRFFSRRTDARLQEILERHGNVEIFETAMHDEGPNEHYQWCVVRTTTSPDLA
jgi:SAM-dependent methyltransferase